MNDTENRFGVTRETSQKLGLGMSELETAYDTALRRIEELERIIMEKDTRIQQLYDDITILTDVNEDLCRIIEGKDEYIDILLENERYGEMEREE